MQIIKEHHLANLSDIFLKFKRPMKIAVHVNMHNWMKSSFPENLVEVVYASLPPLFTF